MTTNECRCGKPTRDAAYVCDDCGHSLAVALGDVPWLVEQLDISVTGQKGIDYRRVGGSKGGRKPSERPSPVSWGPSEARAHLRGLLVSWVKFAHEEGVRHKGSDDDLPADTMVAMSRWLLWRVEGLQLHDIGSEAVDGLTSAVAHCHRIVDRPADRQYLGTCTMCESGRLYARGGSKWARCDECQSGIDAATIRERLLSELDDRLCSAGEIATLSTYLGLRKNREQVRKRVNQWHARGRIHREHAFSDDPVFRFGIVWRLLMLDDETKAS